MIGLRSRLAVALLVFGLCLVYALPSVPYIGTALENVLPSKKINLGLDLKGGIHLTLGVDVAKAVSNSLALAGQDIRRLAKDEKIVVLHPRVVGNDKLEFALPRVNDEAKLQEILQKNFPQLNVGEPRRTEAGLRYVAEFRPEEISRIEDMALDQALRTIRNRIDQFGVAEPDIRKQEGNRIQVQLPGLSDPRRAVQILGQTAHLEFHLVRDDVDPNKAVLPSGVMALPLLEKGHDGSETATRLIAVEKDAMLSGEDVADAQPTFEKNRASVSLSFNSRGATLFENVTGENVGRRMAIVLDDKVYSAPVIQQRIAGGRAVITGQFTTQEATDLAIVLRAGSLPAPVSVLEERTVGPSLGQESIDSGINAALVGAAAVVVFMAIYYGMSGVIADVMLCFTMLIVMAGMAGFGATLTLPGIAGIVLTIGMAVDAIVLDDKVYSAPVIQQRIAGGRAVITGQFTTQEATDLAIVLRAGSLPAPVSVLEERTVGPSLGQESIDSGINAALVGAAAVVVFMAIYYGMSGVIADVMLCFTMLIVMAGMAGFGATLTLPGIAGIVLTIGMAVDANVLIYERIREELHLGLSPLAAVKAGFERATISITDSNLTTIIATVLLYQFGTGPIRGFAVTLSLGIVASMFTAIFVSRAIFEYWARKCGPKGISI